MSCRNNSFLYIKIKSLRFWLWSKIQEFLRKLDHMKHQLVPSLTEFVLGTVLCHILCSLQYKICPFQATYLHFVRTKIRLVAMIVNFCLVWCFNFISRFHPRDSMHRIYWTGLFTLRAWKRSFMLEKQLFRSWKITGVMLLAFLLFFSPS